MNSSHRAASMRSSLYPPRSYLDLHPCSSFAKEERRTIMHPPHTFLVHSPGWENAMSRTM